jgi:hypothetical protein
MGPAFFAQLHSPGKGAIMPNSFSTTTELTCPDCQKPLSPDIWLVVDLDERPDLREKIVENTIHLVTCPRCGKSDLVDAPLLLYWASHSFAEFTGLPFAGVRGRHKSHSPLLLSAAQMVDEETRIAQSNDLIQILGQNLGAGVWQDSWLDDLDDVPRPIMAAMVSDDPEAYMTQAVVKAQAELERLRQEDPEAFAALQKEALEGIFSELDDDDDDWDDDDEWDDDDWDEELEEIPDLEAIQNQLRNHPSVKAAIEQAERELGQVESMEDFIQAAEKRLDLMNSIQQAMLDASPIIVPLHEFMNAENWEESRAILESNPDLLSDDAYNTLGLLISLKTDFDEQEFMMEHLVLLDRCRRMGIPAGFGDSE